MLGGRPSVTAFNLVGDVRFCRGGNLMENVTTVGLDLAKHVFQAHGAGCSGAVVFERNCAVAMSCHSLPGCLHVRLLWKRVAAPLLGSGAAEAWAPSSIDCSSLCQSIREASEDRRGRRRGDLRGGAAADDVICSDQVGRKAVRSIIVSNARPSGSPENPINQCRAGPSGRGIVAAKGPANVKSLIAAIETAEEAIPSTARLILQLVLDQIHALNRQIDGLGTEIEAAVASDDTARRLMTIPGIGPLTAAAICALAPDATTFRCGRDFAAWVGLTPLQRSSGGKERIGRTSRMGERTIRRLLIIGGAVARWASRRGVHASSWLGRMLARKPPMLVRVALANKMARIAWAVMARGENYRAPAMSAA